MKMREIMAIVESVQSVDPEKIIQKMIASVIERKHWDVNDLKRFAELNPQFPDGFGDDRASEMARAWHEFEGLPTDKPEGPQFLAMLEQWARAAYAEGIERLEAAKMVDGKYMVWRAMRVPHDWLENIHDGISLGVYWTYDPSEWDFEPVWANGDGIDIEIEALVGPESVNWESTVLTNMEWGHIPYEFEMRLIRGAPIHVLEVRRARPDEYLHGPFSARA